MSLLGALVPFATIYVFGVIIPGPNFVAIIQRAVTTTLPQALALVMGIVVVNLFWATSAILGVAAVFAIMPWLALVTKFVGAGYLVWFGVRLLTSSSEPLADRNRGGASNGLFGAFRQGVMVNIVNPKSIAFYAAVISAAAPRNVSAPAFIGMLGSIACISSVWYASVAVVFSRPVIVRWFQRSAKAFNRVCGVALIGLGIRNALATSQ